MLNVDLRTVIALLVPEKFHFEDPRFFCGSRKVTVFGVFVRVLLIGSEQSTLRSFAFLIGLGVSRGIDDILGLFTEITGFDDTAPNHHWRVLPTRDEPQRPALGTEFIYPLLTKPLRTVIPR